MRRSGASLGLLIFVGVLLAFLQFSTPVSAQIPTVDIPTVTGTVSGTYIVVKQDGESTQINVREGPGTIYKIVGVLITGQRVPAKGQSVGGEWILIEYPGVTGGTAWVYSPLVGLGGGTLPIVEPPATPTPLVTPTIDPTLAAQFVVTSMPTRLATFTPPPPLVIPTFNAMDNAQTVAGIPVGMVILVVGGLGILLGLFALAQSR